MIQANFREFQGNSIWIFGLLVPPPPICKGLSVMKKCRLLLEVIHVPSLGVCCEMEREQGSRDVKHVEYEIA